jgi:TonB-dependent SusC/RagA subfamily outer membrane receptor
MPFLIQYLIKLSVSLAVVYLFYRFILRPLTFYTWNRWYLAGYSLIAFVIPFIDINPMLSSIGPGQAVVINFIPVIDPAALKNQSWFNINNRWNWILAGIVAGMLVMLVRLSAQFYSYWKLRKSSTLLTASPVKIFQVDKNIVPFSFGNSIFINREQHGEYEMQEIIRHEFIHVKQKHSADMIWAEVLCILNWYNPFAWLIKKVICQNLEFIADQQLLKNGLDKKEYQYLLLKVAGGASFRITNQFNFSFLRKRIAMMNKMKSTKVQLVKFLFILPLLAVLLLSFRDSLGGMLDSKLSGDNPATGKSFVSGDYRDQQTDTIPPKIKGDSLKIKHDTDIIWKDESMFSIKSKNRPLFIVDEMIKDADYVQGLDPNSISSIEVLKNEYALQYGEKGINGVVRIYTKPNYTSDGKGSERLSLSLNEKKQIRLHSVRDSITIEADSIYFDKKQLYFSGKDSVFIDNSRPYQTGNDSITNASLDKYKAPSGLRIRGTVSNPDIVVLIDGVRQPRGTDLKNLDPNSIQSMSVLKDAQSVEIYGADAINGVILINTKQNLPDANKPTGANGSREGGGKGAGSVRNTELKISDTNSRKSEPGRNR